MAVEIISTHKRRVICSFCKSELRFTILDIKENQSDFNGSTFYIVCPGCKCSVTVTMRPENE